jgi:hypothetical protein
MSTPLHLAFFEQNSFFYQKPEEEDETDWWHTYNNICDLLFCIDILVCFNTMFLDDDFVIINKRSTIGKKYISGWFFIDLVAIFPFDRVIKVKANGLNSLVRLTRIGRLSKLLKLTRLLRALKVLNPKNPMMQAEFGFERLLFFSVLSIIFLHIISCLWIIIP